MKGNGAGPLQTSCVVNDVAYDHLKTDCDGFKMHTSKLESTAKNENHSKIKVYLIIHEWKQNRIIKKCTPERQ